MPRAGCDLAQSLSLLSAGTCTEVGLARALTRIAIRCSRFCDPLLQIKAKLGTNQLADEIKSRNERVCGPCTACCDGWLQIEVRGHEVRRGKPCPFSSAHGCSIYSERPQHPCREFICGWLIATSPLPEWMRPDKSDMIMLAANFTWRGLAVDVAVAAGTRPKQKALDWLMKFSARTKRLLIYQIGEAEISERIRNGEAPWAG